LVLALARLGKIAGSTWSRIGEKGIPRSRPLCFGAPFAGHFKTEIGLRLVVPLQTKPINLDNRPKKALSGGFWDRKCGGFRKKLLDIFSGNN
jgi:hypothetical protein